MVVRFIFFVLSLFMLFSSAAVHAEQASPIRFKLTYKTVHGGLHVPADPPGDGMPRLGVALAGGGARAAASVGVLKVLQKEGIPVAAIAGTSMGAAVGGLFAAGYPAREIERIILETDWNDIFNDKPSREFLTQEQKESGSRHLLEFTFEGGRLVAPYGLTAGQKFTNLLVARTLAASFEADLDFDRLPVPYRAVATDLENGDAVVLDHGLLHEAIRASTAIPLVFSPVEVQGRLLADGGLVNNLPVEVVRSMGTDVVIAVDSSAKLQKKEHLASLVEIMSQSISLQVRKESERQAGMADLVITPDTSDYSFADFPSMQGIIRKGEEAALAALPRIRELMKPMRVKSASGERYVITSLSVSGNASVSEATLRFAMKQVLSPREATGTDIRKALGEVYQLGYFSDVGLSLFREGSGYHALLTVTENPVIMSISVSGNTILPKDAFLSALNWQVGRPLNTTRVVEELDRLVSSCRSRGYLLTRVARSEMLPDGGLAIEMYEGRVDSIILAGDTRTSRYLIRRETMTRAGQPLNFDIAAYDIQHLYALDYFDTLSVDMKKSPFGGIDITLRIKEKATNRIRLGLRYDREDRFTGLTDLMVDNVGGRGVRLFLNTRYGNYTDITFGYRSPVVLRMNFLHTVDGFYRDRTYFLYQNKHKVQEMEISRKGAEVSFGYQWFRFGDTYLRYRFVSDITSEILGLDPAEKADRIGSWALLSSLDTRDSSPFAHKGALFRFSYESADPSYGGDVKYAKTWLSGQGFIPLGERHTVVLQAAAGLGSGAIPYQEQYGIGGADHVISMPLLGYQRREFTGNELLSYSAAYRFRLLDYQLSLIRAVYFNLAYQAANAWNSKDDVTLRDMRSGGGIGLYADTVIGPVRLDYGRGEQHRWGVYFSAGFDF